MEDATSDATGFNSVTNLETEANKIARHKERITKLTEQVAAACEDARKDGYMVEFQIALNGFGAYAAQPVYLVKRF